MVSTLITDLFSPRSWMRSALISVTTYSMGCRLPRNSATAWNLEPTATGPGVSFSTTGVPGSQVGVFSNAERKAKADFASRVVDTRRCTVIILRTVPTMRPAPAGDEPATVQPRAWAMGLLPYRFGGLHLLPTPGRPGENE